jgi:hypothetical protein
MLVIIHGWSDSYQSFKALGRKLQKEGISPEIKHILLGNYVSLDDDVTFNDIAQALNNAWKDAYLPTDPRSVDVIVHSTGALVIRHWMTSFFRPNNNPIHRLLMLAPANFGSPLAHKGRSFVGRVIKGFKSDRRFHTGTHILKGLELASPFSWDLAHRDLFDKDRWYGPGGVLCTVLVGTSGYSGISAAANENGTDGTVRVSTASLNSTRISFDFSANPQDPKLTIKESNGLTAFARISGENHSTIALKDGGPKNKITLDLIKESLKVDDKNFEDFVIRLSRISEEERKVGAERAFTQSYQNTVVRLSDNLGSYIPDYFFEVFAKVHGSGEVDDRLTSLIQEEVLTKVHAYGDNPAYRSLSFNTTVLSKLLTDKNSPLFVSVTALPDVKKTNSVGYSTFGYDDIGSIKLTPNKLRKVFQPDRTVLIDMKLLRIQTDKVFSFHEV